ncbi:uncharacterized protein CIMG_13283 [Coccidioides immitis RS]|uniref:Uncharacterized protein n=1 Tax=Coccidioides immitis (strain RS) TaxID=246410 RepID=A0A0D8JU94_COCIM|nr:uncharacterized protein CIMG_13283 [Coccidioides immitis RS]KJF60862.1 hypothetical protein CIMG_13283 [Coccidioides immitis RS]
MQVVAVFDFKAKSEYCKAVSPNDSRIDYGPRNKAPHSFKDLGQPIRLQVIFASARPEHRKKSRRVLRTPYCTQKPQVTSAFSATPWVTPRKLGLEHSPAGSCYMSGSAQTVECPLSVVFTKGRSWRDRG